MTRVKVTLVTVAALACFATWAYAGDYHVGRLLVCSDCHAAHQRTDGKMGHSYSNPSGPDTTWLGVHTENPPYEKLLKGETVNNACLNCHDGKGASGIPDVLGTTAQTGIPNGRSAGALTTPLASTHGYANDGSYSPGTGHTLWSTSTPPGAVSPPVIGSEGLECTDCHFAHGSKYFRNLNGGTATYIDPAWRAAPVVELLYAVGPKANMPSPNTTLSVWEKSAVTNHYDNDNVYYLEPDQTKSPYGDWCGKCHGDFHNNAPTVVNGKNVWSRHPTENLDLSASQATSWNSWTDPAKQLKVMDNTYTWNATATTMTPTCITCHKSHGNQNPFGLIFVYPNDGNASSPASASAYAAGVIDPRLAAPSGITGQMTEEGNGGQMRDMCRNCHGMGRFSAGNPTNLNQ